MIPYAAKAYAAALGNCNSFQTFDDSPLKRPELARIFHGAEPPAELAALNDAGAGVFCTINATDGRGRKASNIKTIRALACDFDHGHPDTWHLPPSMIVRSANGLHVYWFVDDCPLDQFKPAQQRLAAMYEATAKCATCPGFCGCRATCTSRTRRFWSGWCRAQASDTAWLTCCGTCRRCLPRRHLPRGRRAIRACPAVAAWPTSTCCRSSGTRGCTVVR